MKKTIIALSLLLSGFAQAEIVQADYLSNGDNKIFLDTNSGLEWLNINETANTSINNMKLKLANGEYAGFRMATETEIRLVWSYFFDAGTQRLNPTGLQDYYDAFNYVLRGSVETGVKFAYGLVDKEDGTGVALYGNRSDGRQSYYDYQGQPYSVNSEHLVYGIYLVSEQAISYSAINDLNYKAMANAANAANAASTAISSAPIPFAIFFVLFLCGYALSKVES